MRNLAPGAAIALYLANGGHVTKLPLRSAINRIRWQNTNHRVVLGSNYIVRW